MVREPTSSPRIRVLYAFSKLSDLLSSDVLADGSIAERFDLPISRPVQLLKDVIIARSTLFKAFRQALTGEVVSPLVDQDGKTLSAEVSIDADGDGLVKINGKRLRFENVGLLSLDATKRNQHLEKTIARHTLASREAEKLRAAH